MALTSDQLQEAVAVATQYINDETPDILSEINYIYKLMIENKKFVSGGTFIQLPIIFQENESQGFIDGKFDVISNNQNQQFTFGQIDWKYYYCNVSITLDDMTKTEDTPLAIKGLIMGKVQAAKASMIRDLTKAMHGSAALTPKNFNGFGDIYADSGISYANINNNDVPNWLPLIDDTSSIANYSNISNMLGTLEERAKQYPVDDMVGKPYGVDVMISRAATQRQFKNAEQIKQRFLDANTLKAGFKGIEVDGVFWYADAETPGTIDGSTADNYLYVLSSPSLRLFYKYGFGKSAPMDNKQILVNQPVTSQVNYLAGNMGCINRRVNGVFKNLVVG